MSWRFQANGCLSCFPHEAQLVGSVHILLWINRPSDLCCNQRLRIEQRSLWEVNEILSPLTFILLIMYRKPGLPHCRKVPLSLYSMCMFLLHCIVSGLNSKCCCCSGGCYWPQWGSISVLNIEKWPDAFYFHFINKHRS